MLTMGCCRSKVTAIDQNAGISSNVKIVANAPINTHSIPNIEVHYESDEQLKIKGKDKVSKIQCKNKYCSKNSPK